MDKFNELYNKIINEDVFGNDDWTWSVKAIDAKTGEQIGEIMDNENKLIESLKPGPDKVYIYEIATDSNGKQKRNHKSNIIVADGKGGWRSIWSRLQQDLAREFAADDRRANLRPFYKKYTPMAGKGWNFTKK